MDLRLNGHEFEQALEAGEGQGSLGCCSPWGLKELDMTELNTSCKMEGWMNHKLESRLKEKYQQPQICS